MGAGLDGRWWKLNNEVGVRCLGGKEADDGA